MLESTAGWKAMGQMSREILRQKRADERILEARGSVAEQKGTERREKPVSCKCPPGEYRDRSKLPRRREGF
jgi:hypothetical protein